VSNSYIQYIMRTTVAWVIIMVQACTFFRSSFALTPVVSPVAGWVICFDDREIGDTGGHFSDDRYSDIRRADKDASSVWLLYHLPSCRPQRLMSYSWTVLAFASVVVNTDSGGLD